MIVRAMVRPCSTNLGTLGDHHDAPFADVPTFAVFFEVVPNLGMSGDFDVFVDDGATNLRVPTDDDVLEQYRFFYVTKRVHSTAVRQDAAVDASARDDATE